MGTLRRRYILLMYDILGTLLNNGKFLIGRERKLTYPEANEQCLKMGLQMALPESNYENEQASIIEIF